VITLESLASEDFSRFRAHAAAEAIIASHKFGFLTPMEEAPHRLNHNGLLPLGYQDTIFIPAKTHPKFVLKTLFFCR
jgi:hypothetical protein